MERIKNKDATAVLADALSHLLAPDMDQEGVVNALVANHNQQANNLLAKELDSALGKFPDDEDREFREWLSTLRSRIPTENDEATEDDQSISSLLAEGLKNTIIDLAIADPFQKETDTLNDILAKSRECGISEQVRQLLEEAMVQRYKEQKPGFAGQRVHIARTILPLLDKKRSERLFRRAALQEIQTQLKIIADCEEGARSTYLEMVEKVRAGGVWHSAEDRIEAFQKLRTAAAQLIASGLAQGKEVSERILSLAQEFHINFSEEETFYISQSLPNKSSAQNRELNPWGNRG